jgi:hypothetical protein
MSFSPLFSVTQPLGSPSEVTLTDSSTGSDNAITGRRVYLQRWDGTFLVVAGTSTQYNVWPKSTNPITFDLLPADEAVTIIVQWVDNSGNVLYDKVNYTGLTEFNEEFDYGLTQNVASNPLLINDNNFWMNKLKLRILIVSGNNAITNVGDIYSAQQCYDMATELRSSAQYKFNINS